MSIDIFQGMFQNGGTQDVLPLQFLLCLLASLAIGVFLALAYTFKARYTQSFVVTLALIPATVCLVILLVNGSIGAGVAVAGAFNLVRFRSVPGSAKEIGAIFIAMGTGLAAGMGYLGYAVVSALILGCISICYTQFGFGIPKNASQRKTLHVTIPEHLDYTQIFDSLLGQYATSHELLSVKTTNMGSLFKLTYQITLKDSSMEKQMIDDLRCRNGNLEIIVSREETAVYEL